MAIIKQAFCSSKPINHNFCGHCGGKMQETFECTGFDRESGQKVISIYWSCPNYGRRPNHSYVHDKEYLGMGYEAS